VSSPAYEQLKPELTARGLEYLNTEIPTATALPDGSSAFLTTSHEQNIVEFARHASADGDAWRQTVADFMPNADLALGLLGTELWSRDGFALATKALRRLGRHGTVRFTGELLSSCRDWVTEAFDAPESHALLAPWVLHTGLGPDAASSGFMAKVIAIAIEMGGMPAPRGGGKALVDALVDIVIDAGGAAEIETDVEEIVVSAGQAIGVRCRGNTVVRANEAVVANVTPTQLYGRLLSGAPVPSAARADARRFRYGRAEMQIHMALDEPPTWAGDERLADTAIVHVTPGLNGVSRAVNEAERGLLPVDATIVVGQPLVVDPQRAPDGKSILWLQLQELPSRPIGDAADELEVGDGTWTEELREAYADRIQASLASRITNLDSAVLERVVLSPADIEAANINLVGGDIYSGSCSLDQNLLWRPKPGLPGHRTPVSNLFHIGASTHPGPGLGAGSGTMVARELLKGGVVDRALGWLRAR